MSAFEDVLARFSDLHALVVGDLMLDRFVYGHVHRISPEAPAAVLDAGRPVDALGGAGNVASNLVGLGARCSLLAVVGFDDAAKKIESLLGEAAIRPVLVDVENRHTTVKTRFVANMHNTHLLRADWEDRTPIARDVEDRLIAKLAELMPSIDVIVLSDYQKGVLTDRVLVELFRQAKAMGKVSVVDPKGNNPLKYRGVTALTPNVGEVRGLLGRPVPDESDALLASAKDLMEATGCEGIVVTRSENGVLVLERSGETSAFAASAARVVDVSGAGDTLVASFALALVAGAGFRNAALLANTSAGIAVGKKGTSVVSLAEVRSKLLSRPKYDTDAKFVDDVASLRVMVDEWRRDGMTVGFTNGCFDLVHPGHIALLKGARSKCDRLIVAINSDASVRRLKGPTRPIQNEDARAIVLSALQFVDAVILFEDDTPLALIEAVRPDVLIKGGDYTLDQVVGRDVVEAYGGRVALVDLLANNSTTSIVKRVSEAPKDRPPASA